jgi:hypothetical protein
MRSRNKIGVGGSVRFPAVRSRPAARSHNVLAEALESRKLLSGTGLATPAEVSVISLSGAFVHFTTSATSGKKFTETISVTNHGGTAVSGSLPILVELSPDQSLASTNAQTTIDKSINIKGGKTAKIALSLPAPAQASLFHLVIELDPQSTLGANSNTNTFSSASTVSVKGVPFKRGSILGQNGWARFDSASSPVSTAIVSTSVTPPAHGNKETIVLSRAAGEFVGVSPSEVIASTAPFTVTTQVAVNYKTTANGPFFGLDLVGDNGTSEIGTFGVESANGDVVVVIDGSEFLLSDGSAGAPAPLVAGTWNTFKVVVDFTAGGNGPVTLSYFLNNAQVDTATIPASTIGAFYTAYVYGQQGTAAGAPDAAGTAAFDNYLFTSSAPTTLPAKGLTFP